MSDIMITGLLNEDETEFNPPENPLKEKWDKVYPPTRNGKPCSDVLGYYEDGRPIMNYSCVLCNETKCQHSDSWKVPEEDREEYEKYREDYISYINEHNPSLKSNIEEYLAILMQSDNERNDSNG